MAVATTLLISITIMLHSTGWKASDQHRWCSYAVCQVLTMYACLQARVHQIRHDGKDEQKWILAISKCHGTS